MNDQKHNFGYPISYGDDTEEGGKRPSDHFVAMVKTRKFSDICSGIISLVFIIGSQPAHAIPPEAGEHVANLADAAVKAGEATPIKADTCGRIAGHAANACNGPVGVPIGELTPANLQGPGMPGQVMPGGPGKPPIFLPIPRPETPGARMANTVGFTGALGYICLNAYWGNPMAVLGCTVMLTQWFLQTLGVGIPFGRK